MSDNILNDDSVILQKQENSKQSLGKKRAHSKAFTNGQLITAFFKKAESDSARTGNKPPLTSSPNLALQEDVGHAQATQNDCIRMAGKHQDGKEKAKSNPGKDDPEVADNSSGSSNLDKKQAKHQEKLAERLKAASKQIHTPKDSVCEVCKKDTDMLIICSQCSGVFHFACASSPDANNQSDRFICKDCLPKIKASEALMEQKKSKSEKTRKNKADRLEAKSKKQIEKDIKKVQNIEEAQSESTKVQAQSPGSSQQEGSSSKTKKQKAVDSVQTKLNFTGNLDPAQEERMKQVKIELKIFKSNFPELMDGNQVRYPIDDNLIQKLPLLHGVDQLAVKPIPKKVIVDGPMFEDLIAIWEFFANFQEYVDLPQFKVEDLYAGLMLEKLDLNDTGVDDATVEESITKGVSIINQIFISIISCFYQELPDPEKKEAFQEDEDVLLATIKKDFRDPSLVWPEILRICITSDKFEEIKKLVNQDKEIQQIFEVLRQTTPIDFQSALSPQQKLKLLVFLVDCMHDLSSFRQYLNQRQEEKSALHKQKNELHAEIKQLENSKQDKIKELANTDNVYNSEEIQKKIIELEELANMASRTESKRYRDQIDALNFQKNKIMKEMSKVDDQIAKKQVKIEKLNEQIQKSSLKNVALGKDADFNEYWFFKEDLTRIYIKMYESQPSRFEQLQLMAEQMEEDVNFEMSNEKRESSYTWGYYDEEDEVNRLIQGLNNKGIRERALLESMRKILDKLKMKKSKKAYKDRQEFLMTRLSSYGKSINMYFLDQQIQTGQIKLGQCNRKTYAEESKNEESKGEQQEEDKQDDSMTVEQVITGQQVKLLEGENSLNSLESAIWFNKKKPKRRVDPVINTRRQRDMKGSNDKKEEEELSLNCLKKKLLDIEEIYTETSAAFNREWTNKQTRDEWRKSVEETQDFELIGRLLLQLDEGISLPIVLKYKENIQDDDDEMDVEEGDEKNIRRMRLMQFKYWPNLDLRESWKQYLFRDIDLSLQSLFIATQLLQQVNEAFIQRQIEQQTKKAEKERLAFGKQKGANQRPSGYQESKNNTYTGTGRRTKMANYYESSNDEDEDSQEEQKPQKARPNTKVAKSTRQGYKQRQQHADDSFDDSSSSLEESDNEVAREWQDQCYVCRKRGKVMCCESCDKVAHYQCIGLTTEPKEDWNCETCLIKLSQKRTTRGQEQSANKSTMPTRRGRRY